MDILLFVCWGFFTYQQTQQNTLPQKEAPCPAGRQRNMWNTSVFIREWLYTAKKALMDQLVKGLGDRSVYTMHQMVGCFGKWRHWKYEYRMKTSLPCCSGEIWNIFQPQSFISHKTKEKWVDFYFQKAGELGYEEDTVNVVFGTEHYLSWLSNLRL